MKTHASSQGSYVTRVQPPASMSGQARLPQSSSGVRATRQVLCPHVCSPSPRAARHGQAPAPGPGRGTAGSWPRPLSLLRAGDVKDSQASTVQVCKTPNGAEQKVPQEADSTARGMPPPDPPASGLRQERAITSLTSAAASWVLSAVSAYAGPYYTHTVRSRPSDEL